MEINYFLNLSERLGKIIFELNNITLYELNSLEKKDLLIIKNIRDNLDNLLNISYLPLSVNTIRKGIIFKKFTLSQQIIECFKNSKCSLTYMDVSKILFIDWLLIKKYILKLEKKGILIKDKERKKNFSLWKLKELTNNDIQSKQLNGEDKE